MTDDAITQVKTIEALSADMCRIQVKVLKFLFNFKFSLGNSKPKSARKSQVFLTQQLEL